MGIQEIAVGKSNVYHVPYDKLAIEDGFNVREDYGDIDELARSITENGIKTPLEVRLDGDKLIIVDGHRRYQAIYIAINKYKAEIPHIPCINEPKGTNEEDRTANLLTLNSGKPLTPIEQAKVIKRLIDFGWKQTDIAKKIARTQTYVGQLLSLNGSSHELREAVKKGLMAPTAAMELAKQPVSKQKAILDKFMSSLAGKEPDKSKKKPIKVKDIKKAVNGKTNTVSTMEIEKLISLAINKYKDNDTSRNWDDVIYGLRLALGLEKIN